MFPLCLTAVCNPGFFHASRTQCNPCPTGSITTTFGATSCGPCASAALVAPVPGLTECEPCPTNAFGVEGGSRCGCTAGFFGKFVGATGQCRACPRGTYRTAAAFPDDDCSLCPGNSTTINGGATSVNDCVCVAGFQAAANDAILGPTCVQCAPGQFSTVGSFCRECRTLGEDYVSLTPGSTECIFCSSTYRNSKATDNNTVCGCTCALRMACALRCGVPAPHRQTCLSVRTLTRSQTTEHPLLRPGRATSATCLSARRAPSAWRAT